MNHFIDDEVKIFKYETDLPKLHQWLSETLEINELKELPMLNQSNREEFRISNECKDLIQDIYSTDFKKFGYSLD